MGQKVILRTRQKVRVSLLLENLSETKRNARRRWVGRACVCVNVCVCALVISKQLCIRAYTEICGAWCSKVAQKPPNESAKCFAISIKNNGNGQLANWQLPVGNAQHRRHQQQPTEKLRQSHVNSRKLNTLAKDSNCLKIVIEMFAIRSLETIEGSL